MRRSSWRAVCALGMAGALALAACGGDDDDAADTSASGAESTAASTGDSTGGTEATTPGTQEASTTVAVATDEIDHTAAIHMAYTSPITSFDPHRQKTDGEKTYTLMVYDRLTQLDFDGNLAPMLATEWEFSADGATLTMSLRDDVTFHDGTPFNAEAVKVNIEREQTIEGGSNARQLANIASVEVVDEFTVQINLTGDNGAQLPAVFTGPAGTMISPTAIADPSIDLLTTSAGSGPYELTELTAGENATMTAVEGYWAPERQNSGSLTIEYVGDPIARMNGVRSGDFDVAQISGTDIIQALDSCEAGEFNCHVAQLRTVHGALLNLAPGQPLADVKVRQALNYAVDRQAVADAIFGGYCDVNLQPFAPGYFAFDETIEEAFPYDPEKAKALLAEAGAENLTFDMQVPPGSYGPIAQAFQGQLAEVGVTMNIVPTDVGPAFAAFAQGQLQSLFLVVLNYADPAVTLDSWVWGGINMTQGLDPGILDPLKARAEEAKSGALSEAERGDIYKEIFHTLWVDQAVGLPACQTSQVWISAEGVVGVENMPQQQQGTVIPETIGKLAS